MLYAGLKTGACCQAGGAVFEGGWPLLPLICGAHSLLSTNLLLLQRIEDVLEDRRGPATIAGLVPRTERHCPRSPLRSGLPHYKGTHFACLNYEDQNMPKQTKSAALTKMLTRSKGTTLAAISDATGWQRHTVHAFLSRLRMDGTPIEHNGGGKNATYP